ncbi:MAG TPA: type VI secretion system tube protein TssD [Candidatus Dormibacteraeota bacterium]|nr:type VI secretion system tube protein TssD [Candidatus Dormibacteraeota bacterium]
MPIGHSPGVPGDYVFYVSIQGAKQGKFKGEGAHAHKNVIPAHSFSYEVISPRDVATGQATGKRQHSPVTISKEWGAASPQLFQAAVTNEPLQSVLFEFPVTDARGVEVVHHTIKLTNASVASYKMYTAEHATSGHTFELEDVSFTFQKIQIEDLAGKTAAADDWSGRLPARLTGVTS